MDIRQTITDKIIAMLEKGGNEFRARWTAAAKRGFPTNGKTGAAYQGVNVLILWDEAIERGYTGKIDIVAIDDCFSPHGTRDEILSELGLDARGIEKTISKLRGEKNASDYGIR